VATSVYLLVGGTLYAMNDGAPFFIAAWEGLGLLPVNRLSQRGALQHGDTDLGWRGQPRFFSVTFGINRGCTIADRIAARRILLQRIAPRNAALALRFVFDVGTATERTYQIDARAIAEPGAVESRQVHGLTLVPVRFKASDPFFYDPVRNEVIFALPALAAGMPVDTPVDTPIGGSTLDAAQNVLYTGDAFSYPQIRIIGPIRNAVIENLTTEERLDFTGTVIGPGALLDIDCRYANKSVTSEFGANRIADLTDDSDLATFHLAPSETGAAARVNQFRVTGIGVTPSTAVALWYYDNFGGM